MGEGDSAKREERPEGVMEANGGTGREQDIGSQTHTACDEEAGDETAKVMEEVLRRVSGAFSMNIADLRIPYEPPCTEPYARWCGSRGRVTAPSHPIFFSYYLFGHALRLCFSTSTFK